MLQIILLGLVSLAVTAALIELLRRSTRSRAIITPAIASRRKDAAAVLSHWPVILTILIYIFMMAFSLLIFVTSKFMGGMY